MANCKIQCFAGSNTEIGYKIGKTVKDRLEKIIDDHVQIVNSSNPIDFDKFYREGPVWFNKLPSVYQEELSAIAHGSGCKMEQILLWCFCDKFVLSGCTSFIYTINNVPWVGRNNDYLGQGKWNFISIIKANGKIPVLLFVQEAGIFSGTGYNSEKIWLHYNWLPSWDQPLLETTSISPYVFIRQALEECSSVREVEDFLSSCIRDTGMTLFVVDGKTNEFSVYECTCNSFIKRKTKTGFIVSTNHHNDYSYPTDFTHSDENSYIRHKRAEELLSENIKSDVVTHFANILADPLIEQNEAEKGTVYSAITCPFLNKIWYSAGGFPSASNGGWEEINWRWI
jgi:predicted choloylglycine hydrolase